MKRYLPLNVPTFLQSFELFLWLKLVGLGNLKQMLRGSFLKKILHNIPFKEINKISCLVVLFSIFVLTLFLPFFQYHKMLE
jgi:hypothetical protein